MEVVDCLASVPNSINIDKIDISQEGLAVGVPGLLLGLWEVHEKYGKLPWEQLIMPASHLAK